MKKQPTIIKPNYRYHTFQYTPDSNPIKYCKVRVYNDLVNVNGHQIRVNHIFYAPKGHEKDEKYYIEPLKNPDCNYIADAKALKKLGLDENSHAKHPFTKLISFLKSV